ncbi:MAG: hypothetical protein PHV23_00860 [Candidatus Gracilibacteria bacterium]|nr:hypothetical protein [Candidatus Gracilibacteria bacterium]
METPSDLEIEKCKNIILSWNSEEDTDRKIIPEKITNISIKDGMITYMYDGVLCVCENMTQKESSDRALFARIEENKLNVRERVLSLQ